MTRSMLSAARRCAVLIRVSLVASAAGAATLLPFRAKLTLSETVTFTGAPPCFAIGSVQGTGSAGVLGPVTATSQDCINPQGTFDAGAANSFSFASVAGPAGFTLAFANGDRLFVTYSGTLTARPGRPHKLAGQFVITGGTGRFFGATGGGILYGQEDISQVVSGHGEVEALGTIVF